VIGFHSVLARLRGRVGGWARRGPRGRKCFLRRLACAHAVVFTFTASGIASGYLYATIKVDEIRRVPGLTLTQVHGSRPVNFLVIGSDSRRFVHSQADATHFGPAHNDQRSDTMMVVHIDPKNDETYVVSIPRDLWVHIPRFGNSKINTALNRDAETVVETLETDFDFTINHYLEIDFAGLRSIVDAIGGVHMYFPSITRDTVTGLDVPHPGCVTLDGERALAYVRSRQYEYKTDSTSSPWESDKTGDLGRIRRQQNFLRILAHDAERRALSRPVSAIAAINKVVKALTADTSLDVTDIGMLVRALADPNIETVTLPTSPALSPDHTEAILDLRAAEAVPILARLRGDEPPRAGPHANLPPLRPAPQRLASRVSVRVLNGSAKVDAGRAVLAALQQLGFRGEGESTAPHHYRVTEVHTAPGDTDTAALINSYLSTRVQVVNDPSLAAGHAIVMLGRDLPRVRRPAEATNAGRARRC
jgi:polyisoprenyl-teichoic acid--peptidoglycan teichoic acid transferase